MMRTTIAVIDSSRAAFLLYFITMTSFLEYVLCYVFIKVTVYL
jgi:hypothetical protein